MSKAVKLSLINLYLSSASMITDYYYDSESFSSGGCNLDESNGLVSKGKKFLI